MEDHPKFNQIGIFRFENMPSGNPGQGDIERDRTAAI
jgi:hypothetical protein